MKSDKGKPRPSLIYYSFIKELCKVREHGIAKYGNKEDWRETENYQERYLEAIFRHIFLYAEGEKNEDESGLNHLAHAACDIMFLIEGEKNGRRNERPTERDARVEKEKLSYRYRHGTIAWRCRGSWRIVARTLKAITKHSRRRKS